MVPSRAEAKEVPGVHGNVELFDLFPSSTSRGRSPKARQVTKVVKPRWMDVTE